MGAHDHAASRGEYLQQIDFDIPLPNRTSELAMTSMESQGEFANRFAREMRSRLHLPCGLALAHQDSFEEPRVRVNTDLMDEHELGWNEELAWEWLARYYRKRVS